ncbi:MULTISPECIES: 6-hydroxymethylpterin diphosphokinase MptE-like protein [Comamonadaceae]|uniref:6-hydroxymethylpterin diphosphokinase MptE-like protein n=1 Tax=Comamonadaceae TaxID=80864 RepID=UPI002727F8C7|nr:MULTISPECIES: 6-hydroxymethylpterin diphosphokinase MptE-like protein [Comamonadaceae]MDO9145883.1 DUF115 domain-containing protein [Rhodoferax sp.]MDP3887624.1 DUF115 domain-containing protein [Hydrogenophaga sp.]
MSKFDVKDKIDALIYKTYNILSEIIYYLDFPAKKVLKKNIDFRNIHNGERCFILGTGPSLNDLKVDELDALRSEVIFGVNSLYKSEIVSGINPNYYALMDNLYWEQWNHTFKEVVEKYKKKPPIFVTDIRAKKILDNLQINIPSIYIYSKKYPVSTMSEKIDENIYGAMNVISFSILTAIYMGFKEIYLLGCDYSAFCTAGKGHCYDDKSEVSQVNYNLAFYLKFYWITTEFHYLVAKLAREKDVKVINLTPESLLDAYPRMDIGQVL